MNAPAGSVGPSRAALPPHRPLTRYYGSEAEHQAYLRGLFDRTAPDYERFERILAIGSGSWYRRRALQRAGLAAGDRVIDVGIGTGLVAREALRLTGPEGALIGIDPSSGMMAQVRMPGIELRLGRAEDMPVPDASADFLCMGYALRHVADIAAAFAEFCRVLRPGGRLLMLEITRPSASIAAALLKLYMRAAVPVIARLVARGSGSAELWRYYWDTIDACVAPNVVLAALRSAGFGEVRHGVDLGMFTAYMAARPV